MQLLKVTLRKIAVGGRRVGIFAEDSGAVQQELFGFGILRKLSECGAGDTLADGGFPVCRRQCRGASIRL